MAPCRSALDWTRTSPPALRETRKRSRKWRDRSGNARQQRTQQLQQLGRVPPLPRRHPPQLIKCRLLPPGLGSGPPRSWPVRQWRGHHRPVSCRLPGDAAFSLRPGGGGFALPGGISPGAPAPAVPPTQVQCTVGVFNQAENGTLSTAANGLVSFQVPDLARCIQVGVRLGSGVPGLTNITASVPGAPLVGVVCYRPPASLSRSPASRSLSRQAQDRRRPLSQGGMVPGVGIEPTTSRLRSDCSTAELTRLDVDRRREEVGDQIGARTRVSGFADLCLTTGHLIKAVNQNNGAGCRD